MRRSARLEARQEPPQPPTTTSRTRGTATPGPPRPSIATGRTQPRTGPSHPGPIPGTRQTATPGEDSLYSFAFPNKSQTFRDSTGPPHQGVRPGARQAPIPGGTVRGTPPPTPPHPKRVDVRPTPPRTVVSYVPLRMCVSKLDNAIVGWSKSGAEKIARFKLPS